MKITNVAGDLVTKLALAMVACIVIVTGFSGCYSQSVQRQNNVQAAPSASAPAKAPQVRKTYSDMPTPYPNLYRYDADSALRNVYDESKVVDWTEAANYVGKEVTVEGDVDSVVRSSGAYFFNIGGGAYEGFAVIVWDQDLSRFDQSVLRNDANWSASDQPLQIRMRASGVVEMYNGRPQIVAREGSQVAEWINGGWANMISDSMMNSLLDSLYQ